MALLKWIIALPFIVGAILFALAHADMVPVTFSPFHPPIHLPLYFVALSFLGFGFLLGAIMAWIGMGNVRKDRRQKKREIKKLTKENKALDQQLLEALAAQTITQVPIESQNVLEEISK